MGLISQTTQLPEECGAKPIAHPTCLIMWRFVILWRCTPYKASLALAEESNTRKSRDAGIRTA